MEGHAKGVRLYGIPLSTDIMFEPLISSYLTPQETYFTASIQATGNKIKSLSQHNLDLEDRPSIFNTSEARDGPAAVLKHYCSTRYAIAYFFETTSSSNGSAEHRCFQRLS